MPGPAILVVPSAAAAAAAAAHAAHHAAHAASHVAAHAAVGPYGSAAASAAASSAIAAVLAKEAWRRLPPWVRNDPAFRAFNGRKGGGGGGGGGAGKKGSAAGDEGEEEEMAHLTSSLRKLGAWLESGSDALDKSRLTSRARLHASILAFVQLSAQIRTRRPDVRDGLYESLLMDDDPRHVPCVEELKELRSMLDYATWAYVDYYGPDAVKANLAGRGFELLTYAPSDVPGRVGHYVALSEEENVLLIGVKGTSTLEDLLTDAAGKATNCPVGGRGGGEDNWSLDVSVEVDPNFMDVQVAASDESLEDGGGGGAVEVVRRESIFVTRDGTEIRCHEGVLLATRRLCDAVLPSVEKYAVRGRNGKDEKKQCSVVICGHSLGGAAAALLSILLRSRLPALAEREEDAVRAYAFGPPPTVDSDAAFACAGHITSVVNNSDVITRCSVANFTVFLEVLAEIGDRLEDRGMGLEGPKRAAAFLKHLSKGSHADGKMIMSCEEYAEAVARAHDKVAVRDPDHLYVPGRVVLLYEPWAAGAAAGAAVDASDSEERDDTNGRDETSSSKAGDERRNVRAAVAFGTAPPLRFLEIGGGGRAFMDHLTTAYESALDSLLMEGKDDGRG